VPELTGDLCDRTIARTPPGHHNRPVAERCGGVAAGPRRTLGLVRTITRISSGGGVMSGHGKGVDYSFSRPNLAELKAEGHTFVCRYISHHRGTSVNGKDLSKQELSKLRKAGLSVVVVWEVEALDPLKGKPEGIRDATDAKAEADSLGMHDAVIYFACDFDVRPPQMKKVLAYLGGAASVLGPERTGVYGGLAVVKAAMDGDVVGWGWQTYAWSSGVWHPTAQLRQTKNGLKVGGGTVDQDASIFPDFGQWPRYVAAAPHVAKPSRRRTTPSKPAVAATDAVPVLRVANIKHGKHHKNNILVRRALNKVLHLKLEPIDLFDDAQQHAYDTFRRTVLHMEGADATGTVGIKSLTELGKRSGMFTAKP
jgi:hypothetical protein